MATTTNLLAYGGGTQLACSFASLATGSARESASQSNTTNKYFDYLVSITFTLASGTPSTSNPSVNVFAATSNDATLWPRIQLSSGAPFATGSGDASVGALGTGMFGGGLTPLGTFAIQTTTTNAERTFRTPNYSLAANSGGSAPPAFSIIVENQTGVAFSSSTATTANYTEINGVYSTNA